MHGGGKNAPQRTVRRALGWLLVGAFVAAACSSDEPAPLPDWDFFGVVASVAVEEPLGEADRRSRGGPDSEFVSQAMTITFEDGLVVEVPAGAPGGNGCRDLAVRGARNEECVLAGALDESGSVAWFQVLDVVDTPGNGAAVAMSKYGRPSDSRATPSLSAVSPSWCDATIQCHDDASTLPEELASGLGLVAEVSIPEVTVINVGCIYRY